MWREARAVEEGMTVDEVTTIMADYGQHWWFERVPAGQRRVNFIHSDARPPYYIHKDTAVVTFRDGLVIKAGYIAD